MATNVSASIAPAVVNGSVTPKRLSSHCPAMPVAAEGEQQGDAADDRRQHHRQQHQGAHEVAAAEGDAREQPGERHAEDEREAERADASRPATGAAP